jgi:selenocysteine lyase/cysteine desulfurase
VLFPDCPGKFLGGRYELHTLNDASDVDRLLTALAELADG